MTSTVFLVVLLDLQLLPYIIGEVDSLLHLGSSIADSNGWPHNRVHCMEERTGRQTRDGPRKAHGLWKG